MSRLRVLSAIGALLFALGGWGIWRLYSFAPPDKSPKSTIPTIIPKDDITTYSHFSAPDLDQVQVGRRIYEDWCEACHADSGLGLTAEWLGEWDPEHQNCWQAKCHGLDHPSDGFVIPRSVPGVVGDSALGSFDTAADLARYISTSMPFAEKGVLDGQMYWSLTAYLLNRNGISSGSVELGPENAGSVPLGR